MLILGIYNDHLDKNKELIENGQRVFRFAVKSSVEQL